MSAGIWEFSDLDIERTTFDLTTYRPDFYIAEAERGGRDWATFFTTLRHRFPAMPFAVVTNFGGLDLPTDAKGTPRSWADRAFWDLSKEPNIMRANNLATLHSTGVYCLAESDLPVNSQATPAAQTFEALQRGWSPDEIAIVEYLYGGKTHEDYPGLDSQRSYWTWSAEYVL